MKKLNSNISELDAKFVAEQVGIKLVPCWVTGVRSVVEQDGGYFQMDKLKAALNV